MGNDGNVKRWLIWSVYETISLKEDNAIENFLRVFEFYDGIVEPRATWYSNKIFYDFLIKIFHLKMKNKILTFYVKNPFTLEAFLSPRGGSTNLLDVRGLLWANNSCRVQIFAIPLKW